MEEPVEHRPRRPWGHRRCAPSLRCPGSSSVRSSLSGISDSRPGRAPRRLRRAGAGSPPRRSRGASGRHRSASSWPSGLRSRPGGSVPRARPRSCSRRAGRLRPQPGHAGRVPRPDPHPEVGGISIGRSGPTPSTTTAGGPIAPSASPHRWPKPGFRSRSRSTRAMFAGWTCSLDSSTSTTAPPRDRIRVSDPHGPHRPESSGGAARTRPRPRRLPPSPRARRRPAPVRRRDGASTSSGP